MENLSRNELLNCNGGSLKSVLTTIVKLLAQGLYIVTGVKRIVRNA